jgi:RNA polymerase sigma factor (sigma-70 family)
MNVERGTELYEKLIEPVQDRMIAVVTRIIRDRDDAMDVFQEVLAVIWRKLKVIDRHPSPEAYIMRICVTRSYDALRKKARRRMQVRLEQDIEKFKRRSRAEDPTTLLTIREAISLLPPKQGKTVLLRLIEGEDFASIASILGCSPVTARSHFSKGKAQLRTVLEDAGIRPQRSSK